MFHLLEFDGQGGNSLLVDGFYCASILREIDPEAYSILSRVTIPTHAAGDAQALMQPTPSKGYPILNHDPSTGRLYQVRYNNDDRSTMSHLEEDEVEPFYNALRRWNEVLTSNESEYWEQLKPGNVLSKLEVTRAITCNSTDDSLDSQYSTIFVSCTADQPLQVIEGFAAATLDGTTIAVD